MAENLNNAVTLYQLNSMIRRTLESNLGNTVIVLAEIQSISCNRSGHAYLELIEKSIDGAQIVAQARATIWASQYRTLKPYFETTTGCALTQGIKIMVECRVQYHEIYGLSLNITDIKPEYTLGEMAIERQKTINRLKADGVFDMNRMYPLPRLIKRIAVISSAGAAGYGDFQSQLQKNAYGYTFFTKLYESSMQGNSAEASIISQLEAVARDISLFDCVVIIRGGGSKTDLQCFDNYNICQNICQMPLPVITGIGHDRDESVADLVANTHLKTPTAVAQFLIDRALACETELNRKINNITNRLRNVCPEKDRRVDLIYKAISSKFELAAQRKQSATERLASKIYNMLCSRIAKCNANVSTKELLIDAKNPANILKKGYTYTMVDGKAAMSSAQLQKGQVITTVFYDGEVSSTVN